MRIKGPAAGMIGALLTTTVLAACTASNAATGGPVTINY